MQWTGHRGHLEIFPSFAQLAPSHHVLEVGAGTGQMAKLARPRVARLVVLDNSPDMLAVAASSRTHTDLVQAALREIPLPSDSFDQVLVRSVLHHLTSGLEAVVCEMFQVLRAGGRIVIGEGIPPLRASVAHFTEVFRLKEERLVLPPEHLVRLLECAGFADITLATRRCSAITGPPSPLTMSWSISHL